MAEPSEYEKRAWADVQAFQSRPVTRAVHAAGDATLKGARAVGRQIEKAVDGSPRLTKVTRSVAEAGRKVADKVPDGASAKAGEWTRLALASAERAVGSVAQISLTQEKAVAKHQSLGHDVETLGDLRSLDLRQIDAVRPRALRIAYPAVAATSGATAGFVITGSELAVPVSGGVAAAPSGATIAGAMAADVGVVLGLASRAVGQYALAYGYDPEEPAERVFAMSVINWGTALSSGAKLRAFEDLARLTQGLVRGATWAKLLQTSQVARLYQQFSARITVRATKQGLGRIVPVVGIAVGASFNWATLEAVTDAAHVAYRRRFLLEKYPQLADDCRFTAAVGETEADDEVISVLDELAQLGGPVVEDDPRAATEPDVERQDA